jgi:hypothetical protein
MGNITKADSLLSSETINFPLNKFLSVENFPDLEKSYLQTYLEKFEFDWFTFIWKSVNFRNISLRSLSSSWCCRNISPDDPSKKIKQLTRFSLHLQTINLSQQTIQLTQQTIQPSRQTIRLSQTNNLLYQCIQPYLVNKGYTSTNVYFVKLFLSAQNWA